MRNASFRTKVGRVSDSRPTRTLGRIEEYAYISLPVQLSLPDLSDFVRLVRLLSDMSDMSDTVRLLSDLSEIPGPAQTSRTGHSDGCPVRLVRLKSDSDTSPNMRGSRRSAVCALGVQIVDRWMCGLMEPSIHLSSTWMKMCNCLDM